MASEYTPIQWTVERDDRTPEQILRDIARGVGMEVRIVDKATGELRSVPVPVPIADQRMAATALLTHERTSGVASIATVSTSELLARVKSLVDNS